MIVPPLSTKSFYSVLFEDLAVKELMKLIAPVCGGDIEHVIVTSVDLESDIMGTNELSSGVTALMKSVEHDEAITFNPVYLPMKAEELELQFTYDNDGDLESIAGFDNPFICAKVVLSVDGDNIVDGKVAFQQFTFPPLKEVLRAAGSIS
jgi:hypothetical protein